MQILSVLMPGFRELRAPLVSGVLWTLVLCVVLFERRQDVYALAAAAEALLPFSPTYSDAVLLGVLAILIYIMGTLAMTASRGAIWLVFTVVRIAVHRWRLMARAPRNGYCFYRSFRIRSRFHPIPRESIEYARATVVRTLPGPIAERFPLPAVLWDSAASEQQLATSHPEQFQRIDRSRAESDFKIAVAGPMLACSSFLQFQLGLNVFSVTLGGAALLLLVLALDDTRTANRVLWTAVYLGYASPPILSSAAAKLDPEEDLHDFDIRNWLDGHLRDSGVSWQIRQDYIAQAW